MKKFINIFSLILLFVFCLSAFAIKDKTQKNITNEWEQLSNNIFIDKNSVSINKHGYVSAWFKIIEDPLYSIEGIPIKYQQLKYEADCVDDVLALMYIKSYDKNSKLIEDESNENGIYPSHFGVIHGEIYYNALCNYKKDDK